MLKIGDDVVFFISDTLKSLRSELHGGDRFGPGNAREALRDAWGQGQARGDWQWLADAVRTLQTVGGGRAIAERLTELATKEIDRWDATFKARAAGEED